MVHGRPYKPTEKFTYPLNNLQDQALKAVEGYTFTEQSYTETQQALNEIWQSSQIHGGLL